MKDDRLYLDHIKSCIERIEAYVGEGRDAFISDSKTQDAVVRVLQILAESATRLSDPLKDAHPEVDWRRVRGFRNVLVHDYMGIDLVRIWEIVEELLPDLKHHIEAMLQEFSGQAPAPPDPRL